MAAFQISRKVDYALRALLYLAEVGDQNGCTLGDIAKKTAVSPQFLAKIVELLAHRGIVRSRRGPRGGYVLTRPAAEVSFNDVIEAVEGPIALNTCVEGHDDCALLRSCGMIAVWQVAQQRLVEVFARTTLADVCRGGCARGDVSSLGTAARGGYADRAELVSTSGPLVSQRS
jgi:Rrf2 family protein